MANTLTNLIPTMYEALDVVSRELVGFIPAVSTDHTIARAALNQTVISFQTQVGQAHDVTPGVTAPNDGDNTLSNISMTISKSRYVPIRWNGEEDRSISVPNGGIGRMRIMQDQFEQAFRTLCNEMEADLAALHVNASRAYGTAGTTPFASDLSDPAQLRKILDDNGCPLSDRHLIIDTSAGAKMRSLAQLTKANEAGDGGNFRAQGTLMDIHNFRIRESAQTKLWTPGTGASYTTNTDGYAVGSTAITLITGTGTILAGDILTVAGDPNKYVVASALSGGVVTLAAPGLRQAIPASATNVTVVGSSMRSMGFRRTAIALATRLPAIPQEGDMADDAITVTDPHSGLTFEVRLYKQYRQVRYEVAVAWGVKATKPEHMALLLG